MDLQKNANIMVNYIGRHPLLRHPLLTNLTSNELFHQQKMRSNYFREITNAQYCITIIIFDRVDMHGGGGGEEERTGLNNVNKGFLVKTS